MDEKKQSLFSRVIRSVTNAAAVGALAIVDAIDKDSGKPAVLLLMVHPDDLDTKASEETPVRSAVLGTLVLPDASEDRFAVDPDATLIRFPGGAASRLESLLRAIGEANEHGGEHDDEAEMERAPIRH